jgi:LysM repeat protein
MQRGTFRTSTETSKVNWNKAHLVVLLVCFLLVSSLVPVSAQTNLLQNPGFNGSGQYLDMVQVGVTLPRIENQAFSFAPGWFGWYTNAPRTETWMNIDPIAFPHTGGTKQEGDASQNVGRGDGTFTAAAYQTINNIADGTTLRFRAWVFQDSENGSEARTRVGIGSNVAGNPNGSPITWSDWTTAIDSWQQMVVEATVPAGSVTVFIYSTQSFPKSQNQVYYDDAQLIVTAGGGVVNVGSGSTNNQGDTNVPPPPTSTPLPAFAPFVSPQGGGDGGRVEHTVQSGDTLAAIAVAYGVPQSEILALNNLTMDQARFLSVGQRLLIREATAQPTEVVAQPSATTAEQSVAVAASPTAQTVAQQATAEPTQPPTAEPTSTPDSSPTPTEIPATPTDAPPAPVEQGADADPLAVESGVCVLLYDDLNNNGLQEAGENLLAGGLFEVVPQQGGETQQYTTDGQNEPFCFADLPAGLYTVRATAPSGYGLPRSLLSVSAQPGQTFSVRFSAVAGLQVAQVPTPDAAAAQQGETPVAAPESGNLLQNFAGLIVLGLAVVVLVAGGAVAFFLNRR